MVSIKTNILGDEFMKRLKNKNKPFIIFIFVILLMIPFVLGETKIGENYEQRHNEQKAFKIQNETILNEQSNSGIIELNWYQKIKEKVKSWYYQIIQKF